MKSITIIELYSLMAEKIGNKEAEVLTSYIDQKIDKGLRHGIEHLATKADLEKGFKEHTRWMLGVFITLVLMILGLYATILLK